MAGPSSEADPTESRGSAHQQCQRKAEQPGFKVAEVCEDEINAPTGCGCLYLRHPSGKD